MVPRLFPWAVLSGLVLGMGWSTAAVVAEEKKVPTSIIRLIDAEKPSSTAIEVELPSVNARQMANWKDDDARWPQVFSVYVGKQPAAGQPAMLGSFERTKTGVVFRPRFGLEPGTSYSVKLNLPGQQPVGKVFDIPSNAPAEPASLSAVYPSGNKLPENLLRLYFHFSAPMSQGKSYRYLHLFDQTGEEVENPFLELPQELWSPDGKRLTVLLDPGRVKQGLKPREQSGPVLIPGHRYTLTVDESWPDAHGRPLSKPYKREFTTTEADIVQPNPKDWKLQPPTAGTTEPLIVQLDEPLDRAMLQRVLRVLHTSGEVAGKIRIDLQETRWQFTPESPWKSGTYQLEIDTNLEDRVGNSIARPFEVDLNEPQPPKVPRILYLPFEITP